MGSAGARGISLKEIAEVGRGAGQISAAARKSGLFEGATFTGWDINPDAISMAKQLTTDIDFRCGDIALSAASYDLLMCADVIEHVEDTFAFLKGLKQKSRFFIFNIPLEVNLWNLLRGERLFSGIYNSVGHIHFYAKATALQLLRVCGYEVIQIRYANNRTSRAPLSRYEAKTLFIAGPQAVVGTLSSDLSAMIFGDSLVVLTK